MSVRLIRRRVAASYGFGRLKLYTLMFCEKTSTS
jgi:hypothetical protein